MFYSNKIFWSRFCLYIKGRYPWNEVTKWVFFLSEQVNFSAPDRLGRNFTTAQNGPKKRKNLYLIKLVSKWKRAIRKGHTSFLIFHFWDLKLMQIDLALNSASGIFFYRKLTRNRVDDIAFVKFWFYPFDVWPRPVS